MPSSHTAQFPMSIGLTDQTLVSSDSILPDHIIVHCFPSLFLVILVYAIYHVFVHIYTV